jgi:transposase
MAAPRVIGLDEWAWRRGRRFGTIACDLERHQVVDLLPERSAPSVAQWLQAHPTVEIVCRDRSGLYAEGIRQGAPQAIQVVDRFHLVRNLRDALERLFLRYRQALNTLGASLYRASEPTPTLATLSQARHTRWAWPPSRGRSGSVARPSIGISPCPSRPSGSDPGTAGRS